MRSPLVAVVTAATLLSMVAADNVTFIRLPNNFCVATPPPVSVSASSNATFRSVQPVTSSEVCATECAYSTSCAAYQLSASGVCVIGSACDFRQQWQQQTPVNGCISSHYSDVRNASWAGCRNLADATFDIDGTVTGQLGTVRSYTPLAGTACYRIRAWGANGGNQITSSSTINNRGGLGAYKEAAFVLNSTTQLTIAVGKRGTDAASSNGAGGGGGSFVYMGPVAAPTLLLAAGGGGGASQTTGGRNGTESEHGTASASINPSYTGSGGTSGNGAPAPSSISGQAGKGGGGAGWLTDGWRGSDSNDGIGGASRNTLSGGNSPGGQFGGYGGGGGGYSGGGVDGHEASGGGGGGSYAAPGLARRVRGGVGGTTNEAGRVLIELMGAATHPDCTGV